jgi:hypothetical protein
MKKRKLLNDEGEQLKVKEIAVFENPEKLKTVLNKLTWKILRLLSGKEMYPMEIARMLHVHEQKIYYHIHKLVKTNVITVVKEEGKKGAIAKYYRSAYPALGIELPFGYRRIKAISNPTLDHKLKTFLTPFLREDGGFDGKIVVGSPEPHGPFKTSARDGHYASYLTFFLGQFAEPPKDFVIQLDVDVKAERREGNNLILVGGPGTNLITQGVNDFLPTRFNMKRSEHGFLFGGLVSEKTGSVYTKDTVGLISKITNPWNKEKDIIVLAGNKAVGTKACVIAMAKFWKETLRNYNDEENFAVVIQGFDLDGDGKVDSIEVLE